MASVHRSPVARRLADLPRRCPSTGESLAYLGRHGVLRVRNGSGPAHEEPFGSMRRVEVVIEEPMGGGPDCVFVVDRRGQFLHEPAEEYPPWRLDEGRRV